QAQPQLQPSVYAVPVQASTPVAVGQPVTVVDIRMPFGSMVVFMIKWALASIPALIIVWILIGIVIFLASLLFGGLFGGFSPFQHFVSSYSNPLPLIAMSNDSTPYLLISRDTTPDVYGKMTADQRQRL